MMNLELKFPRAVGAAAPTTAYVAPPLLQIVGRRCPGGARHELGALRKLGASPGLRCGLGARLGTRPGGGWRAADLGLVAAARVDRRATRSELDRSDSGERGSRRRENESGTKWSFPYVSPTCQNYESVKI